MKQFVVPYNSKDIFTNKLIPCLLRNNIIQVFNIADELINV